MNKTDEIIKAIAADLSLKYEPPIKDDYWFASIAEAAVHSRKLWEQYLQKIVEKVIQNERKD